VEKELLKKKSHVRKIDNLSSGPTLERDRGGWPRVGYFEGNPKIRRLGLKKKNGSLLGRSGVLGEESLGRGKGESANPGKRLASSWGILPKLYGKTRVFEKV